MMVQTNVAKLKKYQLERPEVLRAVFLASIFVLISTLVLELEVLTSQISQLEVGDVSPQNIVAPFSISYESELATARAKDQAARTVVNVYSRPNPNVVRQQRALAAQIFDYIDSVRVDPHLSTEQKLAYIQAIEPISLSVEEATAILSLREILWLDAKTEVNAIIDEVMRNEIKETDLPSVRFRLGLNISLDVPDVEASVILSIAEDLIQPNSVVDEARTAEKRQSAQDAVPPVVKTFGKNEVVVRAGERVDDLDIEALAEMGLHQSTSSWQDYAGTFLWLTLLVAGGSYYIVQYHPAIIKNAYQLGVLGFVCLAFIGAIRFMVQEQDLLPYALPMAALTIIIAGVLDPKLSLVITILMGLVEGYVAGGSFELVAYVTITGLVVAMNVQHMAHVYSLLWAGLYAAVSNIVVILLFRLFENNFNLSATTALFATLAQLGAGLLGGIISAGLSVIVFLIIGNFTGILTHIQLIELSRPTHPLLAELLRRAPGTYHHSLIVSNLAEQAAIRIGANATLCRVGAYYHDVGKMLRPYFFTENQSHGISLHDHLDSETSAQIIINHVADGVRLAKEHRLPPLLQSFIAQHHGTEVVGYFYHQAVQAVDGDETHVDKSRYTYPGPIPQTKETAILMLADSSEATVRSVQPGSAEEIDKIVRKIITDRMKSGQFNECDLTMGDFEQIRIAFNEVLQGVTHQRVKYPEQIKEAAKLEPGPLAIPLAMQPPSVPAGQNNPTLPSSPYPFPRD